MKVGKNKVKGKGRGFKLEKGDRRKGRGRREEKERETGGKEKGRREGERRKVTASINFTLLLEVLLYHN